MGYTVIFGGTFNPLHIGHYEMLAALDKNKAVDEILLTPDRLPPHKTVDFLAGDEDRINMCSLAAADFHKARLYLYEMSREGKSYSFNTVTELIKQYPEKKFGFACGGDMIATLDTWHRAEELIRLVTFFAFYRTGEDKKLLDGKIESLREKGAEIVVLSDRITEVSSTEIRNKAGTPEIEPLLPPAILRYIKERNIYNGAD